MGIKEEVEDLRVRVVALETNPTKGTSLSPAAVAKTFVDARIKDLTRERDDLARRLDDAVRERDQVILQRTQTRDLVKEMCQLMARPVVT